MDAYSSEKRIIDNSQNIPQGINVGVVQNQAAFNAQQQYGVVIMAPSIPQNGRTIVVNQNSPSVIVVPNIVWGTVPVSITCPFCRQPITTVVEKSFNCATCCLCWCTGLLLFICIQSCSGKEIGCCDAVHKCPFCSNIVGQYSSC